MSPLLKFKPLCLLFNPLSPLSGMLPYGALSTGNRVGFIEVVRKSETIANTQKLEKANAGKRIGL